MSSLVSDLVRALQAYRAWTPEMVRSSRLDVGPDWRFAISSTATKDLNVQAAYNFLIIATAYRYSDDDSNGSDLGISAPSHKLRLSRVRLRLHRIESGHWAWDKDGARGTERYEDIVQEEHVASATGSTVKGKVGPALISGWLSVFFCIIVATGLWISIQSIEFLVNTIVVNRATSPQREDLQED